MMPLGKEKLTEGFHRWPPLHRGKLIRRYKRFLADVELENGETVTAHCPNSGSMLACALPGRPVFISHHNDPKRKLKYTWQIIDMPTSLVGVNTQVPNRLVERAVTFGQVPELAGYETVRREVKTSSHTRLDLLLDEPGRRSCFVEVKNCTLVTDGAACFPDAVTSRGLKHLIELQTLAAAGGRAVIFYLVQRMDARVFHPADQIDAAYAEALRRVVKSGVEMIVYDVAINLEKICIRRPVPIQL